MWLIGELEILKLKERDERRLIRRREEPFNWFKLDDELVEIGETCDVYYMKIGNEFWFSTELERFEIFLRKEEENENEVKDEEDLSDCSYEFEEEDNETDFGIEFGYRKTGMDM